MLARVTAAFTTSMDQPVDVDEPISCHHNYVAHEVYDGVELVVTRKGATVGSSNG